MVEWIQQNIDADQQRNDHDNDNYHLATSCSDNDETKVPHRIANARARQLRLQQPKKPCLPDVPLRGAVLHKQEAGMVPLALHEARWPELIDRNGEEASKIVGQCPGVRTVGIVPKGSMVTMDFREDRVRIFVDQEGRVCTAPRRG